MQQKDFQPLFPFLDYVTIKYHSGQMCWSDIAGCWLAVLYSGTELYYGRIMTKQS